MDRKEIQELVDALVVDEQFAAAQTITDLMEELDTARAKHREEQVRSADRLKIAVGVLRNLAGGAQGELKELESNLLDIEVMTMAQEALNAILKVGENQ